MTHHRGGLLAIEIEAGAQLELPLTPEESVRVIEHLHLKSPRPIKMTLSFDGDDEMPLSICSISSRMSQSHAVERVRRSMGDGVRIEEVHKPVREGDRWYLVMSVTSSEDVPDGHR